MANEQRHGQQQQGGANQPPAAAVPKPAVDGKADTASAMAVPSLLEGDFHEQDIKQNRWTVFAKAGVLYEDVLKPRYWANVVPRARVAALINVLADDMSWYAELIVAAKYPGGLDVRPLRHTVIPRSSVATPESQYEIRYGGLNALWQVVQKSDGRIIFGDGKGRTEEEAQAWLRDYLRSSGVRAG